MDSTPSRGSSTSDNETDEDADDSTAPNDYNPLSGDSPPFYGRECETSSRAVEVFLPEAEDDRDPQPFDRNDGLPLHNSMFGTTTIECDNTTFSFVELGLPAEQYPPASVEAYVPMLVGEFSAGGPVSEASDSPHLNNSGSLPIESTTFPGLGVEWPTGVQPTSLPLGDGFLGLILERVRVVVRAEDPPSIEVVRHALEQNTITAFYMGLSRDSWMIAVWDKTLESDICSLTSDADELDSRASEAQKRQKMRESEVAEERDKSCKAATKAKEAEDASQERAAFAGQGAKLRQSISSKAKDVERLKRKKPRRVGQLGQTQPIPTRVGSDPRIRQTPMESGRSRIGHGPIERSFGDFGENGPCNAIESTNKL
ncbi:hypothetical protein Taro_021605 [Colocasia esculenta]|uniref:Uncharacterized protein n=1 Tax=Colocasia esculenta TaxID=4460 RepID=A0A843V5H5_COLES|nr:hypothetical protein [Colocasia esculenta]